MSEEEKKAIEMLDKFITEHKLYNIKQSDGLEDNIKIVLNLIEKQEKVIDTMAKELKHISYYDFDMSQEEVKQYYYRKVENNE